MARSNENQTSSGSLAVRRIRQSGTFDVGTAHSALELLGENNLYGFLVVSDGLRDVCFFFTRGGLRVVASGYELPTISSKLVAQGTFTREQARKVARMLEEEKAKGKDERGILLERVRLKAPEVDAATREILVECFLDCLFWPEPRYEVATGSLESELAGRRDLSALTLSLGITGLVDEVRSKLRTVSEVRRTISSLHVSVEVTAEGRAALEARKLGDGEAGKRRMTFMRIVAEEPGIRAPDLAERLKIGELALARTLHELSIEGFAKIHRIRQSKRDELERIRKMEEAIDHALSQLLRRVRLATDSADQGNTAKAARHMARAGGILLHQGRDDEAVRTFATALKHSEEDLEAREGYVTSLFGCGRKDEAARESDTLGERYLELGMPSRAKSVLERSLTHGDRATGLQLLVKTHLKLKQPKAAVEAGERLVNRLRREGRRDEAQTAAASLLAYADPAARRRILRAAGLDSRLALVLAVTLILIVLGIVPIHERFTVREAYAKEAQRASMALDQVERESMVEDLERWQKTFTQLAQTNAENEEIRSHAERAAEQLDAYAKDLRLFNTELGKYFPDWEGKATSLKTFRDEVVETQKAVKTEELRGQLATVIESVKALRLRGSEQQDQLAALRPGPQAVAAARDLRERFDGDMRLLQRSQIRFRVETEPPGAKVTWKGVSYSRPTPSELRLPLVGVFALKLEREGYLTVEREVNLEALPDSGVLRVQLEVDTRYKPPEERKEPEGPRVEIKVREPEPKDPPKQPEVKDPPKQPEVKDPPKQPEVKDPPKQPEAPTRVFENATFEVIEDFAGSDDVVIRSSLRFVVKLELKPNYRCQLTVRNTIDGSHVRLNTIEVRLRTKSSRGWKLHAPVKVKLSECERKLLRQGGKEVMQALDNVHGISSDDLLDEIQDALDDAVRNYRRKTFR